MIEMLTCEHLIDERKLKFGNQLTLYKYSKKRSMVSEYHGTRILNWLVG